MLGQCDKCPQWLETVSEEDLSLMVLNLVSVGESCAEDQWKRELFSGQEDGKVCKEGTVDDA